MNAASSGENAAQKPGDLASRPEANSTMISRRPRPSPQVSTAEDSRWSAAVSRWRLVGSIVVPWNRRREGSAELRCYFIERKWQTEVCYDNRWWAIPTLQKTLGKQDRSGHAAAPCLWH